MFLLAFLGLFTTILQKERKMNRLGLGALFVFALVLAVCGSASAKIIRVKIPVVKVIKSEYQPEVTAIAQGGVFAQFTGFDLKIVGRKGNLFLDIIRVEIYSDGKLSDENMPTIGQVFEKICLIANTSPGNSEASERRIVSSLTIDENIGSSVYLGVEHLFGDNASFTLVGIPRGEAFNNYNGRTIGLAVTEVKALDEKGRNTKIRGSFPIFGTEQMLNPNVWAGTVYFGRTTLYDDGRVYQAFFIRGTYDVFVKKMVFKGHQNKDAKISVTGFVNEEYSCLLDGGNRLTACNFYRKERELSLDSTAESLYSDIDGIFLPAGQYLFFYSKNDSTILNHLTDENDLVVIGASMKYRYAPIEE